MLRISRSATNTINLAKQFSKNFFGGEVILLSGDLGAGKTTFTKGIATALNINDDILSPTFTIMNEYLGRLKLYHIDAYRLSSGDEAIFAGLDNYIGQDDAVTVIEWHENIMDIIPKEKVHRVDIKYISENEREIQLD